MNDQYLKAAKAINEVALFFATEGYQLETTFYSNHNSMEVTIYFHQASERRKIEKVLTGYLEANDLIVHNEHPMGRHSKFYTLTLYKNPS